MPHMKNSIKAYVQSDYFMIFVFAFIYVIITFSLAAVNHYTFYTNAWDLGIYAQSLYTTLRHGKILYYTVEAAGNPSRSLFGIHFSPFLFFLVPIYALHQDPITLLMLRPIAISLGSIPLYWILRESKIGGKALTILFIITYLIYPPMFGGFLNFDVLAFLPALFLFALYYVRKRYYLRTYLIVLLALMINEFVSFIVMAMAVYVLLLDWKEIIRSIPQRKITKSILFSILLLITSIAWFALASMVITYFNPTALKTKWEWGDLGSSPKEIIFSILTNPSKALTILFNDGQKKFLYLMALLGPLALIPLIDPTALIMALPWLIASLLSINPLYYSIETQYPAFVSPFIFLAAVNGVKKLTNVNANILKRIIFSMFLTLLVSTLLLSPRVHFKQEETREAIWLALREIPSDASISVMPEVYPHVCNRLEVYPYFNDSVDYVLINVYSWWYDVAFPRPAHNAVRWCDAQIGKEYGIILNMNGVLLYKRGYNGLVKYFKGINFTYSVSNLLESSGKIIQIKDEIVSGEVLVHESQNQTPLFFKIPRKFLPPGSYNVTALLKVSSTVSGNAITFEVRRHGEEKVSVKKFCGEDFAAGEWRFLSFSFSLEKPTPIEIAVYVNNFTDLYFHSLTILQVSGNVKQ